MIRNYTKTAINHLLGDKQYSAVNILGLAFGLAASMLIALYVLDETSYDRQWRNADRIYRVNTVAWSAANGFVQSPGSSQPILPALQRFFPQAIDTGTRMMSIDSQIRVDDRNFEETVMRVDRGFLDMFELETLAGNLNDALSTPANVALRADVARRFFPGMPLSAIIGQTLTSSYNGVARDYQVTAVYRFPAGNTVLDLPLLIWLDESALPPVYGNWGALTMSSYIQLQPGADVGSISANLLRFSDQNVDISTMRAGPDVRPSDRLRFELQALRDIHLNSPFDTARDGGNRTVVIAFTAIAVLVLLIGIINFTILSTAKSVQRGREAALRKTVGASRRELIVQFLGESFCVVLPALLVACMLVELLLPVFEAMVGKSLQVSWSAPGTWLALLLVYLTVGLLGGLYPALVLSHFRPAVTLRAASPVESRGSLSLRSLLVLFQFGVSIALIIATGVIYTQTRYALARDPGFSRDNLLVIDNLMLRADVNAQKAALKTQLQNLGAVSGVALSSHQPTQRTGVGNIVAPYSVPGQDLASQQITTLGIDPDFFSTYKIQIIAGRAFSETLDQPAEIFPQQPGGPAPTRVMLNASAARLLGFATPEAAIGAQIRIRDTLDLSVIGVAADTNFYSMNALPRPEVYSWSPGFTDVLTLRFDGDTQTVLTQVRSVWEAVMGDAQLSTAFVEQKMEAEFTQERVEAQLLVSFSLLAIVIACLGLYGSAAYTVARRTRQIGIRRVLGAEVREIVRLLLWQFSKPVLLANAFAWPLAAWAMLVWLQQFPYQVDALLLVPLCVFAGAIALSIAWLTVASNSLRVATRNPVYALRYE